MAGNIVTQHHLNQKVRVVYFAGQAHKLEGVPPEHPAYPHIVRATAKPNTSSTVRYYIDNRYYICYGNTMQYTTTMTSKGQVTVPVAIRRKLGLKPGQQVRFVLSGNNARLENDNWREELESLGSQVREHMQVQGLKPLSDSQLQQARQAARQAAAAYRENR